MTPLSQRQIIMNMIESFSPIVFLFCEICGIALIGYDSMRMVGFGITVLVFGLSAAFLFRTRSSRHAFWAGFAIGGMGVMLFVARSDLRVEAGSLSTNNCFGLNQFYDRTFPKRLLRRECAEEMACTCANCTDEYFGRHKAGFNMASYAVATLIAAVLAGICAQLITAKRPTVGIAKS